MNGLEAIKLMEKGNMVVRFQIQMKLKQVFKIINGNIMKFNI